MTIRDTFVPVARAISVRLDDEVLRALRIVEATGVSRSDAIRASILGQAERLRQRSSLAAEAAALHADKADRREMATVAEMMESGRGPR
jgi:antitoxin component of RelBE/YafQ-DinJ toxin-antitoxin module